MPGVGTRGTVQWKQEKAGCIAIADFLVAETSVKTTDVLPPPPPKADIPVETTTLEAEGVKMDVA
jgi:hypothetical protein